jgi:ubiquitin carboxyl-terminal hydrolase 4/11/15
VLGATSSMTTKAMFDDASACAPTPEDSDTVITIDDGQSSDSNNVQAQSVEGEDGLVDVSMSNNHDDQIEDKSRARPSQYAALNAEASLPREFLNRDGSSALFDITVAFTNKQNPLGWTDTDEHKDYTSVFDRRPKLVSHRPAKRQSLTPDGAASDDQSSDEAEDIPHDAPVEDENTASDIDLPDVGDMFNLPSKPKRKQKTYSAKDRRKVLEDSESLAAQSLVRPGDAIILDWTEEAYDSFFEGDKDEEMKGTPTWDNMEKYQDLELKAKQEKRQTRKHNGISLDDCLNETGKTEILSENNAWYCPTCKEHRQAEKRLELWKIPDILVMHLKRFSSNRSFRDKLEIKVDYPVEGLDMTSRVIEPEPGKSMIYDLIAVDMHYGGLGGGHYTAYAQNFMNKTWYEYNGEQSNLKLLCLANLS